jgi:hypothetical protein
MDLWITYLLFCALPLLLAWLAIVGSLLLIVSLSERREQRAQMPPPRGGLEQVLQRWKAPPEEVGQPT